MRAQLIIDCGGRVLSALLVTADGQIVPVSQEILSVAARHVSTDVLFDPRVPEHPDFIWEDALETLAKARPRDFFHRARRIGLRRPWDAQASPDALLLASPLTVLSSAAALADRSAAAALPQFSMAILDALLEPAFAFVVERKLAPADVDPIFVIPSHTGRAARNGLQKLVRRRGFRSATLVKREIAATMGLIEEEACDALVVDATDDDVHLHRVAVEGGPDASVRTIRSSTLRELGWSHWVSRIAAALRTSASPAFDRALVARLTGSPESLPATLTFAALSEVLDEAWVEAERCEWNDRLREHLRELGATNSRIVLLGEIFGLDPVRRVFDAARLDAPTLDRTVRGVAMAMRWLAADASRRLRLASAASLRMNSMRGEAVELLAPGQLPAPGESCHFERGFRFAGDGFADKSFLVHLLWGTDSVPEGNATLCVMPLELQRPGDRDLRLTVHLRRSRGGERLNGTAEARIGHNAAAAQFAEELEVRK